MDFTPRGGLFDDGSKSHFRLFAFDEEDILSTFAGIRSVLDTGKADPSKEARDEILWDEDGLITITGGKLTMFRHMAQRTLRFARKYLPEKIQIDKDKRALDQIDAAKIKSRLRSSDFIHTTKDTSDRTIQPQRPYSRLTARENDLERLDPIPTLWAELKWAARHEQVVHLDDLLLRRTRIGSLLPHGASPCSSKSRSSVNHNSVGMMSAGRLKYWRTGRLYRQAYSLPEAMKI